MKKHFTLQVQATSDAFYYFPTGSMAMRLPIPPGGPLHNTAKKKKNYVVSLR